MAEDDIRDRAQQLSNLFDRLIEAWASHNNADLEHRRFQQGNRPPDPPRGSIQDLQPLAQYLAEKERYDTRVEELANLRKHFEAEFKEASARAWSVIPSDSYIIHTYRGNMPTIQQKTFQISRGRRLEAVHVRPRQ